MTHPRLRTGVAVLALAAVGGAGYLVQPRGADTESDGPGARVVVSRSMLACPALGAGNGTGTVVDAAAPLLPSGVPVAAGKLTGVGMYRHGRDAAGSLIRAVQQRGKMASTPRNLKPEAVAVRAEGPMAAGAVATVTSSAPAGVNRGVASTACIAPSAEFWFVGANTAAGRRDVLVLTNLDDANASVDITLYGKDGVLDSSATKGVVVPGRGQTEVYLGTVAPNKRELALRVASTGGRVAAAVRENVAAGLKPAGVDWLPSSAAPSKRVLVPGIPGGAGIRVMTVVNPSDAPATATITVHGASGRFKPADKQNLDIPAGGVRVVKLHDVLRGEAAAVSITSDQPLTAAARTVDEKYTDFAAVGSVTPLTGPAYLAVPAHSEAVDLIVTAPGAASGVVFKVRDPLGAVVQEREVDIGEGTTVAVQLKPAGKPTYLSVEPRKGAEVIAGVALTVQQKGDDAAKVAAWQLSTSQVFRAQVGARPDVRAAIR